MSLALAYILALIVAAPVVYALCKFIERNEPREERAVEVVGYPADGSDDGV